MLLEVFAVCFLPLCSNEGVFAPSVAAFPRELQLSGFWLHKPHSTARGQRSLFSGGVCREVLRSGLGAASAHSRACWCCSCVKANPSQAA